MLSLRRTPFSSMTMIWLENQIANSTGIPHTMGNSLDLGGRAYGFVGGQTTL